MPKKLCTFFLLERLGGKREMRDGDRARESSRRLPGAGPCWPFPGLTSRAARALASPRPLAYKQAALQLSATAANSPVKSSHSQSLHSS